MRQSRRTEKYQAIRDPLEGGFLSEIIYCDFQNAIEKIKGFPDAAEKEIALSLIYLACFREETLLGVLGPIMRKPKRM